MKQQCPKKSKVRKLIIAFFSCNPQSSHMQKKWNAWKVHCSASYAIFIFLAHSFLYIFFFLLCWWRNEMYSILRWSDFNNKKGKMEKWLGMCRIEAAGFSLHNLQIFMKRTWNTATTTMLQRHKRWVFLSEVLYIMYEYNWNAVCHIYILFENLTLAACTCGMDTHPKV